MKKILVLSGALLLLGIGCAAPASPAVSPEPAPEPEGIMEKEEGQGAMMEKESATATAPEGAMMEKEEGAMAGAEAKEVSIQGFAFVPATLTVKKGDTIVFTNKDAVGHTVTALDGSFASPLLKKGDTFTLDTAKLASGSVSYKCTPHPFMTASLVIQ
jgi:plastocyanin